MSKWTGFPVVLALAVLSALGVGCSHEELVASPPPPAILPLPAPARLQGDGVLTFRLPAELAAWLQIPADMKTTIHVNGDAQQTSDSPRQSRWRYQLKLTITDGDGRQTFVSADTNLSGESSQAPTEALFEGGRHLIDMAIAMGESHSAIPGRPTTMPATMPTGIKGSFKATMKMDGPVGPSEGR